MSLVLAGLAGLVFGVGLAISGMTDPARVLGFLDPLGGWDPSLGFVMAGAVAIYAIAYHVITRRRTDPWFDVRFHLPTRRDLDPQLVLGAALFGVGWGLGGYCPGPGLVSVSAGSEGALVFVIAMLAGMVLRDRLTRR